MTNGFFTAMACQRLQFVPSPPFVKGDPKKSIILTDRHHLMLIPSGSKGSVPGMKRNWLTKGKIDYRNIRGAILDMPVVAKG